MIFLKIEVCSCSSLAQNSAVLPIPTQGKRQGPPKAQCGFPHQLPDFVFSCFLSPAHGPAAPASSYNVLGLPLPLGFARATLSA
jgi:hypothetical protein